MEWKFNEIFSDIKEEILEKVTIEIDEESLTIYINENKFFRFYQFNLTKENIIKLIKYLLNIG